VTKQLARISPSSLVDCAIFPKELSLKGCFFQGENPRLVRKCVSEGGEYLSYIQTLVVVSLRATEILNMNAVEAPFTALHRMQRLRDIKIHYIPLTATMLDQLCEVLSTRLYNVELWWCSYPMRYTVQQAVLKIHKLEYGVDHENPPPRETTKMLASIIERSLSSIVVLTLSWNLDLLAYFGEMPRLTSLSVLSYLARNNEDLRDFLVANPQLANFGLEGHFDDLALLLPRSVLPNLRTIRGRTDLMQHLVPGRPVERVEILDSPSFKFMANGVRVLSHSAAPIVELTLQLYYCRTRLSKILDAVVEAVPHLERMILSFHVEVRNVLF